MLTNHSALLLNQRVFDTGNLKSGLTIQRLRNCSKIITCCALLFIILLGAKKAQAANEFAGSSMFHSVSVNLLPDTPVVVQSAYNQIIRLKLITDSINNDDIVIGFNPTSSAKYNGNEDSEYFPGINSPEGLASFSSDSIPLSINFLPYPKLVQQVIRLKVYVANSGTYNLKTTAFNDIPLTYEVWLMDNFKKDSLDIRNNSDYIFKADKTDPSTYGDDRFTLVVRQNQAPMVHLLGFTGDKANAGAQLEWTTENENNYTIFTIERSIDNGITFNELGGFNSTGAGTYNFLDKAPANGVDVYRLKMTDLNNSITYSGQVSLTYGDQNIPVASKVSIFPNPASGVITLAVNTGSEDIVCCSTTVDRSTAPGSPLYDIKIVNIRGTIVKTVSGAASNWQANVSTLLPGSYIIQVVNNSDKSIVGRGVFIKL